MKRTLSTLTLSLLALTACANNDVETAPEPDIEPVESETPEPLEEPTPEENVSDRGSLILEEGEEGVVVDDQGTELLTFTVHSIEVNPECTGDRAEEPENGVFVMFDAEVDSVLEAGDYYLDPGLVFNPHGYRAIDIDGSTRSESLGTNAAYNCLPESEMIPTNLGPGENASGKVVFDVPTDARTLLMSIDLAPDLQWEWEF